MATMIGVLQTVTLAGACAILVGAALFKGRLL